MGLFYRRGRGKSNEGGGERGVPSKLILKTRSFGCAPFVPLAQDDISQGRERKDIILSFPDAAAAGEISPRDSKMPWLKKPGGTATIEVADRRVELFTK